MELPGCSLKLRTINHVLKGLKEACITQVQADKPIHKMYGYWRADVLIMFEFGVLIDRTD